MKSFLSPIKRFSVTWLICVLCASVYTAKADELASTFTDPTGESRPWCYWYWLNKDVTAEGITKDLESMAAVGIHKAMIGNIYGEGGTKGAVDLFSDEWYGLTRHALREAKRVGVEIYMFNSPGWSQSGGPWVTPEKSMRRVTWQEFAASGGHFSKKVRPEGVTGASQDIAVLAIPRKDAVSIEGVANEGDRRLELSESSWIWHPSENAAVSAPAGTRYFTRVIEANPEDLDSATVRLTADNHYLLTVNGETVASDGNWKTVENASILPYLKNGQNTISIAVTNAEPGQAGLLAAIQLTKKNGDSKWIVSDQNWRVAKVVDDLGQPAREMGGIQMKPWSRPLLKTEKSLLFSLSFASDAPITARGLLIDGTAEAKLYAVQNGEREFIAEISATGGRAKTDFLPDGVESFSFKDSTAKEFVLEGSIQGRAVLTTRPTVAQVVEKQMGRMHPTPSPTWESYIFPDTVEPGETDAAVMLSEIIDLSDQLSEDGVLDCVLPEGDWRVISYGMITTGKMNHPAAPEGRGLEVDKMSRAHARYHFDSYIGELLDRLSPEERTVLTGLTIDSYEVGAQNWTDGFAAEFKKRNGYDPIPLLPVLTGLVIDSAKTSDQFLWDLRRTVSDMIGEYYIGGLREVAHERNMKLWCENYGHWGFPGEFTVYGAYADEVAGEFWSRGTLGNIECRAASSTAHIYGKNRVYAEAFTNRIDHRSHPYTLKRRGDEMFFEGINHFVLHVYAHQPRDGVPGNNPWFGTAFHRNTPWFKQARDWVKYLQRCHTLLQLGRPSAEVLVYIGDFAPQMTGPRNPVPVGYDFDYIGSDAILRSLDVLEGDWVVYDETNSDRIAARWPVMAMPDVKYIRPQVRAQLERLKAKGGRVLDGVPVSESALRNKGVLPAISGASCAILGKARELEDGMLFFLSNFERAGDFEVTLRVKGKAPELFNPMTGQIKPMARYEETESGTRIKLKVEDPADSYFIVFRNTKAGPSVVSANAPASKLDLFYNAKGELIAESAQPGSYTLRMSDGSTRLISLGASADPIVLSGPWQKENLDDAGYTVLHTMEFSLPTLSSDEQRVYLDLGQVEIMAAVTLNDTQFDTLWMPPFRLDVTDALKLGKNQLSVKVTSTSKGSPKLAEQPKLVARMQSIVTPSFTFRLNLQR